MNILDHILFLPHLRWIVTRILERSSSINHHNIALVCKSQDTHASPTLKSMLRTFTKSLRYLFFTARIKQTHPLSTVETNSIIVWSFFAVFTRLWKCVDLKLRKLVMYWKHLKFRNRIYILDPRIFNHWFWIHHKYFRAYIFRNESNHW